MAKAIKAETTTAVKKESVVNKHQIRLL